MQSWPKGINGTGGSITHDIGEDVKTGGINQYTAGHAIGIKLNYYGGDYIAINSSMNFEDNMITVGV